MAHGKVHAASQVVQWPPF